MRQGELLGLRWQDVDLDSGTLTVNVALSRQGGAFVLAPPKTERSRRLIPLDSRTVEVLRAHKLRQAEARMAAGKPAGLVFTTQRGLPLHASEVLKALRTALRAAGLPPVTFHSIRHSAAMLMLSAGLTLEDVKQRLGHSTITLTSNTYSHFVATRGREVADVIGRRLEVG